MTVPKKIYGSAIQGDSSMKDVFISYSSLDRKIAEEVCESFEKRELSCWISSRINDLEPGREYTERIREAVDSSKLFIVLLSQNSITSKQVLQEITLANDRQRFGMKIFPVVIDNQLDNEDIRHFAGYVLSGKEIANWNIREEKRELIRQVILSLSNNATDEVAKLHSQIPEIGKVIGREAELQSISKMLQDKGRLCLIGIGGIGKTALLLEFCHSELCMSRYNTIIYLSVERCLLRTIANDRVLKMDIEGLEEKRKKLSSYEYALYKLSLLENSVNERTLIIIDNIEYGNDPLFDRISSLKCDVLFATRYADAKFSNIDKLSIERLQSLKSIHELFEMYYGNRLESNEYDILDNILSDIHFHTMTVILLAKQMNYFGKRPHDYQNKNQLRIERVNNLAQIMSESMNDNVIAEMYTQLFDLFDASTLSSDEKKIMKTMCILPSEGIYRYLFINLIGEKLVPIISKLENIGWIQDSSDRTIIMLHPLVRDVVMHELEIHLEDPDVSAFFTEFIKMISNSWNGTYQNNLKFKELALSIYYQFPTPTRARYKEYLILSKLLWVLDCMDIGLEIQNKVKMLFVDEDGKRLDSAEEAEAFLQIGFTYQGKGDYTNAAIELERAATLYGNKYAAALSHLAQAYMTIKEKTLEEIEPFLVESLKIREKYWPGTTYEAASCHLYAKTLSNYENKLDYAIQLEKRAYGIFTKVQPGGVNVSSAAYILGWLYVQTAEDDDDIEFGIKNLEEAKNIRIKYRGDPLHSWMEDIYLKLGLAYEKYNNYQKAKEYFELLLKVRKNKFKDNPSQRQLIEVYELLEEVYSRLGDNEGMKKCKKYLRYYG